MSEIQKNSRVWDEIEAGRYKTAHKTCVRRLEKGESSDYLQVLRVHALSLQAKAAISSASDSYTSGLNDYAEASKLATRLASRPQPIVDTDALRLLFRVCMQQNLDSTIISGALERAAKAKPKDLKVNLEWFNGCVKVGNWKGAQAAAMVLQKTWANTREYFFWAAASSWLFARSFPDGAMEKKLFGTLAYRMITKAKSDVPEDTSVVIPAKAIQTPQEIHLLLSIVIECAANREAGLKEALEILESNNLGVNSKLAEGDWWGLVRRKLEVLEELKEWEKVREECKKLLAGSIEGVDKGGNTGKGDDWRVWEGLLNSTETLLSGASEEEAQKLLEDSKTVIENHKAVDDRSRNILLADCFLAKIFDLRNTDKEPKLLDKVKAYFDLYGTKNCFFDDIRLYIEALKPAAQNAFIAYMEGALKSFKEGGDEKSRINAVIGETNKLKIQYLLDISAPSSTDREALVNFVDAGLRLYKDSLPLGSGLLETDNQHGDEAAILSVLCLTRLYHLDYNQSYLYRALHTLEELLEKSPHNYQALLLTIRLSILAGAPSHAAAYYPELSVKQIMNETISHYYVDRISTLMPIALPTRPGASVSTDILPHITNLQDYHFKGQLQSADSMLMTFEKQAYFHCEGFVEFGKRFNASLSRILLQLDARRVDRFRRTPTGKSPWVSHANYTTSEQFPEYLSDNRDYAVVVNWEHSSRPNFYSQYLTIGPIQTPAWARAFSIAEQIVDHLSQTQKSEKTAMPTTLADALHTLLSENAQTFSFAEATYLTLATHVARAFSSPSSDTISAIVSALNLDVSEALSQGSLGYALHARNQLLDACALIELFLRSSAAGGAKLKKNTSELREKLKATVKALRDEKCPGLEHGLQEEIKTWGEGAEVFVRRLEVERARGWSAGEQGWKWVA